jgi:hypothetical protein
MQSLEARSQYRNSFHCAYRIFTEEGVLRFWTGTTPRLIRLVVSNLGGYTCHLSEFSVGSSQVGSSSPCTKRSSPLSMVDLNTDHKRISPDRIFLSTRPPGPHYKISDLFMVTMMPLFCTFMVPTPHVHFSFGNHISNTVPCPSAALIRSLDCF